MYKPGLTGRLGEMISNRINISNQVWVLKVYEVIEILGVFFHEEQGSSHGLLWHCPEG